MTWSQTPCQLVDEALVRSTEAVPGSDHQLTWVEAFVAMATTAEHVAVPTLTSTQS